MLRLPPDARVMFRFLLAGLFNTVAALAVYWTALACGAPIWAASAASISLGILVSFQSHSRYVFGRKVKFVRYAGVWIGIYAINLVGLYRLDIEVGKYAAAIVLLPVNVLVSFALFRLFVFRTPGTRHRDGSSPRG